MVMLIMYIVKCSSFAITIQFVYLFIILCTPVMWNFKVSKFYSILHNISQLKEMKNETSVYPKLLYFQSSYNNNNII